MDIVPSGDADGQLVRNIERHLNPVAVLTTQDDTSDDFTIRPLHHDEEAGDLSDQFFVPVILRIRHRQDLIDVDSIQQLASIDVVEDVD